VLKLPGTSMGAMGGQGVEDVHDQGVRVSNVAHMLQLGAEHAVAFRAGKAGSKKVIFRLTVGLWVGPWCRAISWMD
jgi:hypothetical protein